MKIIVPKNHISLVSVNDINSICAPLFHLTEIDFLYYARFYRDNTVTLLSSNGDLSQSYVSDLSHHVFSWEIINTMVMTKSNLLTKNTFQSYWLVSDVVPSSLTSYYANRFNTRTGIGIAEKLNDCYELFWFDSSSKKSLNGFYLDNLDILVKFIFYFREKAHYLIKLGEKSKIIVPNRDLKHKENVLKSGKECFEKSQFHDLHKMLDVKHYSINLGGELINITNRECDCLLYLGLGYSLKKIASLMGGISPRTVESHLNSLKVKFRIYSTEQLLLAYHRNVLSKLENKF